VMTSQTAGSVRSDTDASDGGLRSRLGKIDSRRRDEASTARLIDLLVDAVGVCAAGRGTASADAARSVLGTSAQPWDQAWLCGIRIHALDFDDTHEPSLCHTGASLVPALLALAVHEHRSGAELLDAFEFGLRLVDVLSPFGPQFNEMGLHSTGIVGTIGAAGGASRLVGGNLRENADAIEIAALMTGGLGVAFGSDSKPVQAGRAAEAGVRAALLAQAGIGAPTGALLGPRGVIALWLGADAPEAAGWPSPNTSPAHDVAMKPYPSCFLTHSTIDLALETRAQLGTLSPELVRSIRIDVHPIVRTIADKTLIGTEADSKFSIRYCVLATLAEGVPALGTFRSASVDRLCGDSASWANWVERCRVETTAELPRLASRFSLETVDGRTFVGEVTAPHGSVAHPLNHAGIDAKFRANLADSGGGAEADRLIDELRGLESASDLAELPAIKAALAP
jgi:2-methylcitrate dehydratase PrpD